MLLGPAAAGCGMGTPAFHHEHALLRHNRTERSEVEVRVAATISGRTGVCQTKGDRCVWMGSGRVGFGDGDASGGYHEVVISIQRL